MEERGWLSEEEVGRRIEGRGMREEGGRSRDVERGIRKRMEKGGRNRE